MKSGDIITEAGFIIDTPNSKNFVQIYLSPHGKKVYGVRSDEFRIYPVYDNKTDYNCLNEILEILENLISVNGRYTDPSNIPYYIELRKRLIEVAKDSEW